MTNQIVLPGVVDPDGLQLRVVPRPEPGARQALVRVEASGVSFAEQQMRRAKYFDQPPFPFVPGYDLVGRVVALGGDADPTLDGRRVAALTKLGAWAEHVVVDAERLVRVPDGVGPIAAEAIVTNGLTAQRMLHREARVVPGETIVVHGATGGVGTLLVRLGLAAGARVVGIGTNPDAVEALGAVWVDRHAPDLVAAVEVVAPGGADVVFDHVGGEILDASWRMLAPAGRLVSYGTASTRDVAGDPMAPVLDLMARLERFAGAPGDRRAGFFDLWEGIDEDPAAYWRGVRDDLAALLELVARGELDAPVAGTWPLREAGAALAAAEAGGLIGKVVLVA